MSSIRTTCKKRARDREKALLKKGFKSRIGRKRKLRKHGESGSRKRGGSGRARGR